MNKSNNQQRYADLQDAVFCTECSGVLFSAQTALTELSSWSGDPYSVVISHQCNGCLQWHVWSLRLQQPVKRACYAPCYWSMEGSHYGFSPN
jgi:hypothetical protein